MKTKPYQNLTALAASIALGLAGTAVAEKHHDHDDHKDHDHADHGDHADHKDQGHADHEGHDHAEKISGPNGGRVLTSVEPHLEFFLTEDRKVKITAVDDEGEAIALGEQTVRVIGGSRSNPTRLSFTKDGDSLVSDKAFPEGDNLPVIVQIKAAPDAKTVIEKFALNLSDCPTCEYAEYACACDHGDHEGHDH
jgi:hypothetical protein